MIVGLFAPIFLAIQFFVAKKNHVTVLGWICTSVSIAVFAAPLSAVIHVVRTGRVESMPIALIGCLIVSAGAWLIYGFLLKNIYIYLPNVIGLALGAIQLSVYGHYSRTGRRQPDIEVVEDVEEIVGIAPESDVEVELVEQHGRLVEVAGGASALATAVVDDDAATAAVDDDAATAPVDDDAVDDDEIKDAWLDNVEIDPRFAGLSTAATKDEEEAQELSSKDVAIMKRRIANVLEPEETVLQCLRRLKGSGDRKTKMSGETKIVFDQLTEDAMKLMENGEYDVYNEKKDVFEREAEGYEELARARGEGTSSPLAGADDFDMFADDDSAAKPSTNENNAVSEPSSDAINSGTEGGALQSDYVYDESSGYYYSSSLGYYYDPNTGLYCSAESGKWYSYNEEAGTYDEVPEVSTNSS
ncbi:uncharacterized protein LOC123904530 [Trifolium pratense]|uniref:uncharacterized protein LOC123904530 n=1 Tax=Trifolium pratense TaxID=57577 RepID=UPI001E69414A|nr:uncharacterized protein LOC123904530 [Trifolium pratense]